MVSSKVLILTFLFFTLCNISCNENTAHINNTNNTIEKIKNPTDTIPKKTTNDTFDRSNIVNTLKNKVKSNKPLIVHILVPLCDNEHQGIVPTSKSLGNGLSLKSNLYWATTKGMKRYFKELPDWKLIKSFLDVDTNILERVVFYKEYKNNAKVYLAIDAYRGDKMKECIDIYLKSLAGIIKDTVKIDNLSITINGNADLIGFNGHNGLMDNYTNFIENIDGKERDAAIVACISYEYFKDYFIAAKAYPLITTTDLLYPGAFIFEAIINSWAQFIPDEQIKNSAGYAYHKEKKCGINCGRRLFKTGW